RGLPGAAGTESVDAGRLPDGTRRRRRPRRRPRHRRRRLPREAVLLRGAARPPAGARAAGACRAAGGAGGGRPPARSGGAPRVARRDRARALAEGVRAPRALHAPVGRGAVARAVARRGLGHGVREPLERRRRLRPLPAREDRPAVRSKLARDRARRRLPPQPRRGMIASLPLRVRLTLPFALAMAVVLVATGAFVYVRVGSALLTSVDQTLRAQAAEALPRLQQGKSLLDQDVPNGAGVAELLAPGGAVVATSRPGLPPLLDAADRSRVLAGRTLTATRDDLERLNDDWRLLAMPVRVAGARD